MHKFIQNLIFEFVQRESFRQTGECEGKVYSYITNAARFKAINHAGIRIATYVSLNTRASNARHAKYPTPDVI